LKSVLERFADALSLASISAFIADENASSSCRRRRAFGKTIVGGIDLNKWRACARVIESAARFVLLNPTASPPPEGGGSGARHSASKAHHSYGPRHAAYDLKKTPRQTHHPPDRPHPAATSPLLTGLRAMDLPSSFSATKAIKPPGSPPPQPTPAEARRHTTPKTDRSTLRLPSKQP